MRHFLLFILLVIGYQNFAQDQTGVIEQKDATIFYKVFGKKGRTVLFINGGPGFSSNYLDDVASDLAKRNFRVVLFDQRGTGRSTVRSLSNRHINLRKNLKDIDAVIDHLSLKKVDVIGHAYGSVLALMYGVEHPEKVRKMILTSPTGTNLDFAEPMVTNLKLRLSAKRMEISGTKDDHKKRLDLMAEAYVYNPENIAVVKQMHQLPNDYSYEINQIIWDEMRDGEFDITERVQSYRGEVLILHGRQDVIGESVALLTHLTLPNSELHYINEAVRYLWIDQPEIYFNYLTDFLK